MWTMNALQIFSIDMYLFYFKFLKITYRCQGVKIYKSAKEKNTCIEYKQQRNSLALYHTSFSINYFLI